MPPQREDETSTTVISSSDNADVASLQEPLLGPSRSSSSDNNNNNNSDHDHDVDHTTDNKDVILPSCCGMTGRKRMNHNVFLNLLLSVLYGISNSLWNGTAFAAYLKKLGHDKNGPLGNIEAVQGLTTLLAALPMGYVADTAGRSKVIRAGGILLLLTTITQIIVLVMVGTDEDNIGNGDGDDDEKDSSKVNTTVVLWIMGVIMCFWGLADGVVTGPCMALFADSIPEGDRSTYYNYSFVCYTSASACGPLVSIILFQTLGDTWSLYHLAIVIYVGLGLEAINAFLMMFFDDRKALDEDGDDSESEEEIEGDDSIQNDNDENTMPPAVNNLSTQEESTTEDSLTTLQKRQKWIPYIVFSQGLVFAVASGMTVKFFPLFFKDEIGMTPSQVQIIYCLVPFVMSIASTLCTRLANTGFGRVQAMLLYSVCGVALLYSMVFCKSYLDSHPFLLVPIYVLRTSFMNASYPLQESILMDFVPKDERARWKSLDSVASFGWCGSAAFGGWLADKYDYTYTFLITSIMQTIGIFIWCLLLPLVPRTEGSRVMETDDNDDNNGTDNNPTIDEDESFHGFASKAEEDIAEMERSLLGVPFDDNPECTTNDSIPAPFLSPNS
jgi:MFS family permease